MRLTLGMFVATLFFAEDVLAHCRATTCDQTSASACSEAEPGCQPQIWASSCLGYVVDFDGSSTAAIDYETARAAVRQAFETWLAVDCGDGQNPSFRVYDLGPTECQHADYQSKGRNASSWTFRDEPWDSPDQSGAHALTFTTMDDDGTILDADVEVNTSLEPLTTGDIAVVDLGSVLVHEAGHVLGLGHSEDPSATMFAHYEIGSIAPRDLAPDDVTAICAVYPPDRPHGTCGSDLESSVFRRCGPSDVTAYGCSVTLGPPASTSSRPSWFVVVAGVLLRRLLRDRFARACDRSDHGWPRFNRDRLDERRGSRARRDRDGACSEGCRPRATDELPDLGRRGS